jgi:hypothetical protein
MGIWITFGLVIVGGIVTSIVAALTYSGPYSIWIKVGVVLFWTLFMLIVPLATWRAATVQPKVVAWAEYAPQETQWSPALFRKWQQNRMEYRAKTLEEMDVWAAGKVESKFRLIDVTDGSQGTDPEPDRSRWRAGRRATLRAG